MAILTIDEIYDRDCIRHLINYLIDALESDEADRLTEPGELLTLNGPQPSTTRLMQIVRMYDERYYCDNGFHLDDCTCVRDAAHTDPRQGVLLHMTHVDLPRPRIHCPERGSHRELTECWACWCDVERGALFEDEALRTWEVA